MLCKVLGVVGVHHAFPKEAALSKSHRTDNVSDGLPVREVRGDERIAVDPSEHPRLHFIVVARYVDPDAMQ